MSRRLKLRKRVRRPRFSGHRTAGGQAIRTEIDPRLSQRAEKRKLLVVSALADRRSDDELLVATAGGDSGAFGVFYERHVAAVVSLFVKRTGSAELAADLTGETFAAALLGARRFRPGGAPAAAWLLGIGQNKLRESARRHHVAARARERLGMPRLTLEDQDLERIAQLDDEGSRALALLAELSPAHRDAIRGRVIDGVDYPDLAERMGCSEHVARQNVSRGLRRLRTRLREETDG
jgi:RNA polymerase sigma factor (sigma-70 family)